MRTLLNATIVRVEKDKSTVNGYDLILDDGRVLHVWRELLKSKRAAAKKATVVTLPDYLRSIGISSFWIDRRVNGFRIKPKEINGSIKKIMTKLKKIDGITAEHVQRKKYSFLAGPLETIIIRTKTNPSLIKINNNAKKN